VPNKLNGEFAGTGIYSILKLVPVGIIILESSTGKITYANDRAVDLYGVNPIGLKVGSQLAKMVKLFKPDGEVYPPQMLPASRALQGEKIVNDEEVIERPNGSKIIVCSTSAPLNNSNGEIIGSVAIFEDITEKKALEKKLDMHMEQLEKLVLEQVEQLKNSERLSAIGQTAGMIGHDIRNPLQAIFGDTYLLRKDVDSLPEGSIKENMIESIAGIEENLSYINKVILDLQDYAKTPKPNLEVIVIGKILQETLSTVVVPKEVQVTLLIEDDSLELKTDPTYMKRIMANLISNAIQALPNGGKISIGVKRSQDKALVSVKDTGQGIPLEVRDKIFTPLVTTKPKGQGFGLAVVKKLTEALNGNVTFESELGKGTQFNIELPLSG
jgi:PAS domain S-box-containing protein